MLYCDVKVCCIYAKSDGYLSYSCFNIPNLYTDLDLDKLPDRFKYIEFLKERAGDESLKQAIDIQFIYVHHRTARPVSCFACSMRHDGIINVTKTQDVVLD